MSLKSRSKWNLSVFFFVLFFFSGSIRKVILLKHLMDVQRRLKSKTSCFLAPSAFRGRPALIGSDGIHPVLEGGDGKKKKEETLISKSLSV